MLTVMHEKELHVMKIVASQIAHTVHSTCNLCWTPQNV